MRIVQCNFVTNNFSPDCDGTNCRVAVKRGLTLLFSLPVFSHAHSRHYFCGGEVGGMVGRGRLALSQVCQV